MARKKNRKPSKSAKAKARQQQKAATRASGQGAGQASSPAPAPVGNPTKAGAFTRAMRMERAAQLIAKAEFTIEEVAIAVGVHRDTIYEWQKDEEFVARIAQLQERIKAKLETLLISQKFFRQMCLQEQLLALRHIKDARSAKMNVPEEEGGESGYMVRRLRMIGSGENATVVEEFVVDTAFAREYRDTLKQAAQEAGELVDKLALTSPDGKDEFSGIPAIDLEAYRQLPIAERIRLLRSKVRAYPVDRGEPSPEV